MGQHKHQIVPIRTEQVGQVDLVIKDPHRAPLATQALHKIHERAFAYIVSST